MNEDKAYKHQYQLLAAAIIGQAVQDYEQAYLLCQHYQIALKNAQKVYSNCEEFFTSGYFAKIAEMDGKRFLRLLNEKIKRIPQYRYKTILKPIKGEKYDFLYCPSRDIQRDIDKCKTDVEAMKLYNQLQPQAGFAVPQHEKIAKILLQTFIVDNVEKSQFVSKEKTEKFKSELEKSLNNCFNILKGE